MSWEILLVGALSGGVGLGTPLLLAALGEIFAERSGILNLGIEGTMLAGAFLGFWAAFISGNLWFGIIAGMVVGGLIGLLMGILSVSLRANQIVSGMAITLLGIGLSIFLNKALFGMSVPSVESFKSIEIPLLSQIPVLGMFFNQNILVYIGLILVPICSIVLFRTTLGLRIRAVGENPEAADSLGISVYQVRYLCIIIGGIMAGLAGAYLSLGYLSMFTEGMSAGRGWIAVVIVIFCRWTPRYAFLGALLFGFVDAFQIRLQLQWIEVPAQLFFVLPYLVAIVVLVLTYGRQRPPAALCVPYKRGGK